MVSISSLFKFRIFELKCFNNCLKLNCVPNVWKTHLRLLFVVFFSPSLVVWLNLRLCARNPNPKHAADRAGTVDMLVRSSLVEMVHLFSRGSSKVMRFKCENVKIENQPILARTKTLVLGFSPDQSENSCCRQQSDVPKLQKNLFFLVSGFWNDNCANSFSRIWNLEVEENLLLEPAIRVSQHLGNEWYFRFFAFLSVSVKWYHDA